MKLEKLVGERFKEKPSDCVVESHALMVRGGYMKYVANGIFSSYTPLKRITKKIENIVITGKQDIMGARTKEFTYENRENEKQFSPSSDCLYLGGGIRGPECRRRSGWLLYL